jgi:hypothetical protein
MLGAYHMEKVNSSGNARWKPWHKWAAGIFAALLFVQVYFVRELLAALLLFTVVFSIIAVIIAVIYMISRAGEAGFAFAEPAARRGFEFAEELSRKTFHRPRSAPVP